jgi:mycofactocin system FadH/OYE family oxidoreductase 1
MRLLERITLGGRQARNRLMFGPHVTNLGLERSFSDRHVAYYQRRAVGGAGIIVLEEASVHHLDWPYERAPLAAESADGWARCATALRNEGSLGIAALGHSGGQGSSAYSQRELMAPSRVPDVGAREVPKWMEAGDIHDVVAGFGSAAALAIEAGLDGVEINAGQHSLVRQFLSGLTNHRGDEWGGDRLKFARDVLAAVRGGVGADAVVGLRLSCDELAPWAGITPEMAEPIAAELAQWCDYIVVVRGSIYTTAATRPDGHEAPGFNRELCGRIKSAVGATAVVLQGSIIDPSMAEAALDDATCDVVEMTRAQMADPDLGVKIGRGTAPRPCILCNQTCMARDARNPIATCVVEPTTGHETTDPNWTAHPSTVRSIAVVGGGPAGLEAAITAAQRGHQVRLIERSDSLGGQVRVAAAGAGRHHLAAVVDWQIEQIRQLGVHVALGDAEVIFASDERIIAAVGSMPGVIGYEVNDVDIIDVAVALHDLSRFGQGTVVIDDPIGGPIAVSLAECLGGRATLITQDQIAGNELARSGDLAPANVRLAQQGVTIERRSLIRSVHRGTSGRISVTVEDRFSGEQRSVECDHFVNAGFRLPKADAINDVAHARAGDAVAPRTIAEAILEGRRAVLTAER